MSGMDFTIPLGQQADPSAPVGAYTVATAREEVRARLGETIEDFWTDAQILRALNEAQRRFSFEKRWNWLYTTVTNQVLTANTPTFALKSEIAPQRHFDIILVRAGDTKPLPMIRVTSANGFKLRREFYASLASPRWWYLESAAQADQNPDPNVDDEQMVWTVHVVPTPDVNCTLEYQYIRNPRILASDADILDCPQAYMGAIIAFATASLWFNELNGQQKAQEQFALYQSILDAAVADQNTASESEVVSWGGEEPQWGWGRDRDTYSYTRITTQLG